MRRNITCHFMVLGYNCFLNKLYPQWLLIPKPSCVRVSFNGVRTFGRRLGDNFFEMTIWATRVGRLGDKNEALRLEQRRRVRVV